MAIALIISDATDRVFQAILNRKARSPDLDRIVLDFSTVGGQMLDNLQAGYLQAQTNVHHIAGNVANAVHAGPVMHQQLAQAAPRDEWGLLNLVAALRGILEVLRLILRKHNGSNMISGHHFLEILKAQTAACKSLFIAMISVIEREHNSSAMFRIIYDALARLPEARVPELLDAQAAVLDDLNGGGEL